MKHTFNCRQFHRVQSWFWTDLEDAEPLEAFATGALGVKYSALSSDLAILVDTLLERTKSEDIIFSLGLIYA